MTRCLLVSIFLVATATAALADTAPTAPTAQDQAASDCARARKLHRTCVLSIEAEDVTGKGVTGDGTVVTIPQFGKFTSLIHVRQDFRAEIIKSAENL